MIRMQATSNETADPTIDRLSLLGADSITTRESAPFPMVLHVRVVTGQGGGPEKTILNSPRFLDLHGYRAKLAYMHPPGDPGLQSLRARGHSHGRALRSVGDR